MYYLIFLPLYLISLLPLRLLYFFGDGIYALLYYVFGYRKEVVMGNLAIAFPEKTIEERTRIAKDFYHNFVDTFIETLKFISWSYESVSKRFESDLSGIEAAYATGKNIHLIGLHNFNWEYVNWGLVKRLKYDFVGIYMPVGSKPFDRIIRHMRGKHGTLLIPATDFRNQYMQYKDIKHVLGIVADQSPGKPTNAYWLNFFGKPTGFVTGPEKSARLNDCSIVFAHFYKTKRGHYRIDTEFIADSIKDWNEGDLTKLYVSYVEKCIRKEPANYLWSHRRWKHSWKEEYGPLL